MSLLSECIGAKAFEAETFFEMALRDVQLIPSLEGSTHINLALAAQFIPKYFDRADVQLPVPASLVMGAASRDENPYLMEARTGAINTITFSDFLSAYKPLISIANVRLFARQAKSFELLFRKDPLPPVAKDTQATLARGNCLAIIAYAQLVAENAILLNIPTQIVSAIFHLLVLDLGVCGMTLASSMHPRAVSERLARRVSIVPQTSRDHWEFIAERIATDAGARVGVGP
jgi:acyl-CoA dehydrogenase